MLIQVILDPGCPWCYIGKRQLERALALRPGTDARLSWWSFLLNPDLPLDGIDHTTYFIRKFGSEARVGRIHMSIADVGQSVEIDFAFDRIRRTPNTVNAHRLIRFAGLYGQADRMVEALFYNHFVRGRDIGDMRVLIQIGGDLDLDVPLLRAYLRSDADLAAVHGDNARAHRTRHQWSSGVRIRWRLRHLRRAGTGCVGAHDRRCARDPARPDGSGGPAAKRCLEW